MDFLSHYAIGHTGGKFLKDARVRVLFYMGNFLPDLVFKAFLYITNSATWFCEPSHSPVVLIFICYSFSLLFEEILRKPIFWALLIGSYLHLFLDAFKSYMGQGVVLWAFPFSMNRFEFGLLHPYETLYLMLPSTLLIIAVEVFARMVKK